MKKIFYTLLFTLLCSTVQGKEVNMNSLTLKQQNIAKVGAYTARGDQAGLKTALIESLEAGISVNELKEILVQAYAYCGFPRSLNALTTFMNLENERGNKDEQGKLPSAKPQGNSIDYGTENQTKLVGQPVSGKLFEFAPAIDEYLKAHLFGDIFARDTLDWQAREIATIAMLSAMDGTEGQLKAHIEIGRYNGLTDEQVAAILNISGEAKSKSVLFGFGQDNTAYAQYFSGNSYLQPLVNGNISAANITFAPSVRNNWHVHHKAGQTLLVISGRGYYQEWGKPAQELKPGDTVDIPAEVKHWHGAAPDSWFTHVAISVPTEGASNEWLEAVTDADYQKTTAK